MLQTLTTLDQTTPDVLRPVLQPLPALTEAGTRLLDAASDLFYLRGVRAVGVDLIAETAGTTKKTLYDRFGSKDALVALYLLRRAHRWREHLLTRLADAGVTDTDLARQATVANEWCSWSSTRFRPGWALSDGAVRSSTPTPSSATARTRRYPSSARRRRGCAPCSTPSPVTPTWEPTST